MVQLYNRWVASILEKHPDPTQEELEGPIEFLQEWDSSKEEERGAWAVALWHVVHSSRIERSTGSAAFHAFSQELVDMIAGRKHRARILVPDSGRRALNSLCGITRVVPLVGALRASQGLEAALDSLLTDNPQPVEVTTQPNGDINAGFFVDGIYIGQIPKDHPLFGSVPTGLRFTARIQRRGRTVYLVPEQEDWLMAVAHSGV